MDKKNGIIIGLAIVIAGLLIFLGLRGKSANTNAPAVQNGGGAEEQKTGNYTPESVNAFAKCLTAAGVQMYGAVWCPHCQRQKSLFGDAVQYINLTECPDQECTGVMDKMQAAGIEAFPTWILKDGTKLVGEQTFEKLASVSKCPAPTLVAQQ